METTVVYRGYIGILEKKMEATNYLGFRGLIGSVIGGLYKRYR